MPRHAPIVLFLLLAMVVNARAAAAQGPPPRIGPFVVDVHGTVPRFPTSDQQLADSRGLLLRELPGAGLGVHAGAHVYVFSWKAVTFGLGADVTVAGARRSAPQLSEVEFGRATTERFTHVAPQISFNFGDGDGWSYFSGGIGTATWSLAPTGDAPGPGDTERLQTINYGGGARWFIKKHLAFSFDVRFYAINPGTPALGRPGSPRTTLMIAGAGISLK
ncbi:MAG: hypothetical protein AB7Q29_00320 [Vicinamibacterales bacterium]